MSLKWVSLEVSLAIHSEQISRHGGLSGVRDIALLESALARPQNIAAYEQPDIAKCASAYLTGIVKNHPFQDGNKRTGFVVSMTFLILNGKYISASESDVVITVSELAAGKLTEADIEKWLTNHLITL